MVFLGLILTLFLSQSVWAKGGEKLSVNVSSECVLLINADTGTILFEKNAQATAFPASITKIATALYALKMCGDKIDQMVVVKSDALASITPQAKHQSNYRNPAHWLETDGNHIGMKKGEEISLRYLLYAMLISSANDAANVIAQHIGGTIPKFMEKLNAYLKEIGCKDTHFLNPHGFHHPEHVTTAVDMGIIAKEAMKYPLFREIVSTVRFTCPQTNLEPERNFIQTNLLLRKGSYFYPKAIGIKTGTTRAAGKTLVAAAKDGDRTLIAVILGNRETGGRFQDAIHLFEAAFNQPKKRRFILNKGLQTLSIDVAGGKNPLKTSLEEPLFYDYFPSDEPKVKATVAWKVPRLPIEKGVPVGSVKVVDSSGHILKERPLLAAETVEPTFWYRLKMTLIDNSRGKSILFVLGATLMLVYFWFLRRKTKNRSRRPLY